ncbi:MAG TPA: hypothetical protein VLM89_06230 [Phycisphaerae bacterium]|nr:hypothetical protein [Phycisphaerae bacterium]
MQLHRPQEPRNIWGRLPTMLWRCPVSELKPAAEVLAEQPGLDGSPGRPAIILQRAGNGLVLFVGTDETWRWRYEVGDRYFHQFWAQATMFVGLPHRTRNQPGFAPDTAPATLPANIEQQDVRARPDLLSRLAGETGGRAVSLAELPELCKELAEAALQEQETSNLLPWDHWLMLVVFAALLCGEWILRKKWHLP